MSDAPQELTGPDLIATGIRFADLREGTPILGHASGEPVLVARVGDDVLAVGAVCTHYSGPLAQGLIVGDTVRCPWHHACFSLRTGEALRAPALNPIACWTVERRGEQIHVGEKREREPLAPIAAQHVGTGATPGPSPESSPGSAPRSVVIIGGGAAGSAAAEMLHREGYAGRITVVDDDPGAPYDRPNLSKDYLAGNAPEAWIPLRREGFYGEHGIALRRSRAERIEPKAKQVKLADGTALDYDALLLASGAEPIRLDVPGGDQPHVRTLRSLTDSRALIEAATRVRRAVVIGASFIGLEVAASLRQREVEVDVVAPGAIPLARVFGPELGRAIQALHEQHGVRFHLERKAARIEPDAVILEDGERLPADLVVVGIGVKPRVQLAEAAGLQIDRGVVVNQYLETSVPGIYAAGDIARWPDPHTGEQIRVEHWVVAQRQGQTAARNILGQREAFETVPFFWSAHYDTAVSYIGHAERWDEVRTAGDIGRREGSAAFRAAGRTLAVATMERDRENLEAELAMEEDREPTLTG